MSSTPLVSVAMPVRNGERFLAEAVESILGQSWRDFEFVIIDDASTDNTWAMLERFAGVDRRIRLMRHDTPNYLGAMNACCQAGRGRYIARMDADDVAFPDRLERQVALLESHSEVAVVGGGVVLIDERGRKFGRNGCRRNSAGLKAKLRRATCFVHPSTVIRRSAMESVGWFRAPFVAAQAYDLWLRLSERYELARVKGNVLCRRYHPQQVTFSKMVAQATCSMAARASAQARRDTGHDPLDGVTTLTPEVLCKLGIEPAELSDALIKRGLVMAKHMIQAGYLDAAMAATIEAVKRARVKPMHMHGLAKAGKIRAVIHWQQARLLSALAAAVQSSGCYALLALERMLNPGERMRPAKAVSESLGGLSQGVRSPARGG